MSVNLTEIIASIAHLDNVLSRAGNTDEGIVAITVDPQVFNLLVQLRHSSNSIMRGLNRMEMAGVIIRKGHGLTDTTQPEIKKRAG